MSQKIDPELYAGQWGLGQCFAGVPPRLWEVERPEAVNGSETKTIAVFTKPPDAESVTAVMASMVERHNAIVGDLIDQLKELHNTHETKMQMLRDAILMYDLARKDEHAQARAGWGLAGMVRNIEAIGP